MIRKKKGKLDCVNLAGEMPSLAVMNTGKLPSARVIVVVNLGVNAVCSGTSQELARLGICKECVMQA